MTLGAPTTTSMPLRKISADWKTTSGNLSLRISHTSSSPHHPLASSPPLDSKLRHAGAQGVGMETEDRRRPLRPADPSRRLLEGVDNIAPLQLRQSRSLLPLLQAQNWTCRQLRRALRRTGTKQRLSDRPLLQFFPQDNVLPLQTRRHLPESGQLLHARPRSTPLQRRTEVHPQTIHLLDRPVAMRNRQQNPMNRRTPISGSQEAGLAGTSRRSRKRGPHQIHERTPILPIHQVEQTRPNHLPLTGLRERLVRRLDLPGSVNRRHQKLTARHQPLPHFRPRITCPRPTGPKRQPLPQICK